MTEATSWVREQLAMLADAESIDRIAARVPSIERGSILGVPGVALDSLARRMEHAKMTDSFLDSAPHASFEEDRLHAIIVSRIPDYDGAHYRLRAFLPYVHDWITCDRIVPAVLSERHDQTLRLALDLSCSDNPFAARLSITVLARFFLDDWFDRSLFGVVAGISLKNGYVQQARVRYFVAALEHQPEAALSLLAHPLFDRATRHKIIQRALRSSRIGAETKLQLFGIDDHEH